MTTLLAGLNSERFLFSIKTFIAAFLALGIGLYFDLPRPYWAMGTAYIVAQPFAGGVTSRGLYRVIGTVAGAFAAAILTPLLVNAPELLCLSLTLWIGVCLFFSLLNRSPSSYAFVLAGYSAAIIGFPSVLAPDSIVDTAIARAEEITIGITCSALVSRLVFPRHIGTLLTLRVDRWLGNAGRWAIDVLSRAPDPVITRADRHRLATDTVDMLALTAQLSYDTSPLRSAASQMRVLQQRMTALLPLLSGIDDRLAALGRADAIDDALATIVDDIKSWIAAGETVDAATTVQLKARLDTVADAGQAATSGDTTWHALLRANLIGRLREIVEVWEDCLALRRAISEGRRHIPPHLIAADKYASLPALHLDYGIALLSALSMATGTLICCAFWILTGWHDGAGAATMVAVFSALFSTIDNPVPLLRRLTWTILISSIIAGVYLFVILPQVNDFLSLMIVFAPFLLLAGAYIPDPVWGGAILLLCANTLFSVALQPKLNLDFAAFLNSNIAVVAGILVATAVTAILRSLSVEQSIQRLLSANAHELASLTTADRPVDIARLIRRFVDRFGLMVQRSAALPKDNAIEPERILAELRLSVNVGALQQIRSSLPANAGDHSRRLLAELHQRFRSPDAKDANLTSDHLRQLIDATIVTVMGGRAADRYCAEALNALIGIRCALFPAAPGVALSPDRPQMPLQLDIAS